MRSPSAFDETIANVFARAYHDTGSLADAFWVTERVVRQNCSHDIGAAGFKLIVADVARRRDVKIRDILGSGRRDTRPNEARDEVYWLLRQRKLSYPAIGAVFGRHHSAVMDGVRRHEARMRAAAADQERAAG